MRELSCRPVRLSCMPARPPTRPPSLLASTVPPVLLAALLVAPMAPLLAACSSGQAVLPAGPPQTIVGSITAGPTCPVERNPPESGCAPRPIAGAAIVVEDSTGHQVGRTTSGPDGRYRITIAVSGTFSVRGMPVPGLMGVPRPATVTLAGGIGGVKTVDLEYDTGIR